MVPQQPDSPSSPSEASDPRRPSPDLGDIYPLLAALTERITTLEAEVRHLAQSHATAVPAPPAMPQAIYPQATSYDAVQAKRPDDNAPPAGPQPAIPAPSLPPRSLEDRLGSQIFNRIGIVAILIGATWFLKLAMDNHWIGPLGRVLIGLIAGAGLVVWSERFRRHEFAAFSYSLKAVGTSILYLSLWASFQLYQLIPAEAAFALMLLVTLWNTWMAWSQQSEVLAAYAVAGAFSTPALLSTGGNHQVFLFSYLLTIDVATLVLVRLTAARSKSWSRLLLAILPATVVYFIAWYTRFYTPDQLASTSLFIALFFAAFFTVPFRTKAGGPGTRTQAEPISDVLIPLANAVFASLAFYFVLDRSSYHAALPWISLVFAALYLAAMRIPALSRLETAAARAVHLSLAVLFLTIAIPLKARGLWIIIGWLAEGVALLWISARLGGQPPGGQQTDSTSEDVTGAGVHKMLRRLAAAALTLGFIGLLVLPEWFGTNGRTVFNRWFATEVAGILAFALAAWIAVRALKLDGPSDLDPRTRNQISIFPTWLQIAGTSIVSLNLIALITGIAEINIFWLQGQSYGNYPEVVLQMALSISAFLMLYGAGLLAVGFWKHSAFLRWQGLILLIVAIVKTFVYDVRDLSQGYRVASFLGLGALLMAVSFAYVRRNSKLTTSKEG